MLEKIFYLWLYHPYHEEIEFLLTSSNHLIQSLIVRNLIFLLVTQMDKGIRKEAFMFNMKQQSASCQHHTEPPSFCQEAYERLRTKLKLLTRSAIQK